ncbi:sulfotransferase family protein [Desulfatiglans anilini]|uniref:sulfotransferase family protein n=1 Tax=Desulfatiglans anilini TaxID=90728 RepID=UPI00137735FC|nr:sulfotransferase [Desulfatiglans anilini]
MQLPNFFIIGAPKSGTTALSEYLKLHPEVFFSTPKELHFFNDDFSHRHTQSLNQYISYFSTANENHKAIGEGSVFYLSSNTAVQNILNLIPNAKFIILLRNPIEASYAWHWQAIYSFGEQLYDFENAWRAQPERLIGKKIDPYNRVREALQYGMLFKYGEHLQKILPIVSPQNLKIILFENFKSNTDQTYQDVLAFLHLSPYHLDNYNIFNSSKHFQYKYVEQFLRICSRCRQRMHIRKSYGVITKLKKWNTKYAKRPPLSDKFKIELINYFSSDLQKASELIRRDLTGWLRV